MVLAEELGLNPRNRSLPRKGGEVREIEPFYRSSSPRRRGSRAADTGRPWPWIPASAGMTANGFGRTLMHRTASRPPGISKNANNGGAWPVDSSSAVREQSRTAGALLRRRDRDFGLSPGSSGAFSGLPHRRRVPIETRPRSSRFSSRTPLNQHDRRQPTAAN